MKIIFICQVVDQNDTVQAGTVNWISKIAKSDCVSAVDVLALRIGSCQLPSNVNIHNIGKGNKITTLARFYSLVLRYGLQKNAIFFVYQNGPYPLLLLPIRIFFGKKVFQWLAHPHKSWLTRLNTYLATTMVFTSTRLAHPFSHLKHVKILGQSIDINRFMDRKTEKVYDFITIGRITARKQLQLMLSTLVSCKKIYGVKYKLAIIGGLSHSNSEDKRYLESLHNYVNTNDLADQIFFLGEREQSLLPELLSSARFYLFFCTGALGRAVIEAMACRLPVITCNVCVKEILSDRLIELLYTKKTSPENLANTLHSLMCMTIEEINLIRDEVELLARESHSDVVFFPKLMNEIRDACV